LVAVNHYDRKLWSVTVCIVLSVNLGLELCDIFQTFEELEGVKDKQSDIIAVRQLLDEQSEEVTKC
jgi:hypothetical protein